MVELLLPAGNLKKLKTAYYFGADAAYVGMKALSLRAFADNFGEDDMKTACSLAKTQGKKLYVTMNIYAKNSDLAAAEDSFKFIESAGADGVIVSDCGLLALAKKVAPSLEVHVSTQANVSNKYAVRFFAEQGASRVVLARELSVSEIKEIKDYNPDVELEAFVHGAMCVSMSGRCLLSDYFIGRSGNRGECAQPCRWRYRLSDDDGYTKCDAFLEQDDKASYIMSSKDLNLLNRLPELIDAGVSSFKVEGRMKSEFYVATVARAYRAALDDIAACGRINDADELQCELDRIAHRPYTEAFFDGNATDTVAYGGERIEDKCDFIAVVQSSVEGRAQVEMRNRFYEGDVLQVLSPAKPIREFEVKNILTADGTPVADAKLVQHLYTFDDTIGLRTGDILRREKL